MPVVLCSCHRCLPCVCRRGLEAAVVTFETGSPKQRVEGRNPRAVAVYVTKWKIENSAVDMGDIGTAVNPA